MILAAVADVAVLVGAITGGVAGVGGLLLSWRKDTAAAEAKAKEVAQQTTDRALLSLAAALDRSEQEQTRLGNRLEAVEAEMTACHKERDALAVRVQELERVR